MSDLKPANENPWYVLATLYGEQEGEEVDEDLAEKNRRVWSAWACQKMSADERAEVAESCGIEIEETEGWAEMAEDIAALHAAEMQRRNGDRFAYPGLPDVQDSVDLSKTLFSHSVLLEKSVFPAGATLEAARFIATGSFSVAHFRGDALFHRVRFEGDASFHHARFCKNARFDTSSFDNEALFYGVQFDAGANFYAARFNATATFLSARFNADAGFYSAFFLGTAYFDSARFDGQALFERATFGTGERARLGMVVFSNTRFERPLSFRQAVFHQQYPDFSGATLPDKSSFTAEEGYWPKQLDQDTDIALTAARDSCATIRHVVGKQGLPEDEHFFFRKEMGFARRIGPIWQRVPYIVFGVLSDYGYSISKPTQWLAVVLAAPLGVYAAHFAQGGAGWLGRVLGALGLSFASTFKFFGFQRLYFSDLFADPGVVVSLLTAWQTVLGYTLLFFLGLGLRQRFRLR